MYDNGGMDTNIDWRGYISAKPGVVGGKPAVTGTRLSVEFLLGLFAAGWTHEVVMEEYDLSPEALRAVFAYAAEMVHEEVFYPARTASTG